MQNIACKLKHKGLSVGLVPTMGALHAGHLSLIRRARKENDIVIVSIFVNPVQFGPGEDYLKYPKPFKTDSKKCRQEGVDYIFVPSVPDMYPAGHLTYVNVEKISGVLCGAFRPGHFRGVATVVAKLFNIAQPGRAYFGMKDYQQLQVIKRFVKDLNFPVKIAACPIVRESSGLALSSRNQYLSHKEHVESSMIFKSLKYASEMVKRAKVKDAAKLKKAVVSRIKKIRGSRIDYVQIADAETLEPVNYIRGDVLIAVAVWVGRARLIDNILVNLRG